MRIGVIFVGYNTEEYIEASLRPWLNAASQDIDGHGLDGNDFVICAVNVPFIGFPNEAQDKTREILLEHERLEQIHLISSDTPMAETAARGAALYHLIEKGCDLVIQVDSDEGYTQQDISRIFAFVKTNPFIDWFRICLKNYVFDTKTYLKEPFTPPRIHRVKPSGYKAHSFSGDNDIQYGGTITRDILPQSRFASMTIPQSVAWPAHFSWLDDDRSQRKIRYQLEGRKWPECSFAWKDGHLEFNKAYFAAKGLPLPEVITE